MISEFFINIWVTVSTWFLSLLPQMPGVEDASFGVGNILRPVAAGLTGLGGWIPWGTIAVLLPISVALYIAGFVLRAVKSLIPTISG